MIRSSAIFIFLATAVASASASSLTSADCSLGVGAPLPVALAATSETPRSASEWDEVFGLTPRLNLNLEVPQAGSDDESPQNVLRRPAEAAGGDLTALFCALGGAAAWQISRAKRFSFSLATPEWYASDARQIGHTLPLDLTFPTIVAACLFEIPPDPARIVTRAFAIAIGPSESQFTPRAVIPRGPPLAAIN